MKRKKPRGRPLPPPQDEEFSPEAMIAAYDQARQNASEHAPAELNAMLDAKSREDAEDSTS